MYTKQNPLKVEQFKKVRGSKLSQCINIYRHMTLSSQFTSVEFQIVFNKCAWDIFRSVLMDGNEFASLW